MPDHKGPDRFGSPIKVDCPLVMDVRVRARIEEVERRVPDLHPIGITIMCGKDCAVPCLDPMVGPFRDRFRVDLSAGKGLNRQL